MLAAAFCAHAFDLSMYASHSRLAQGHWVKISVAESGLHCITNQQLQQWGFSNPSAVRIYGYGGRRIDDYMTASTFIDDLPPVQFELTGRGLVFYATGPEKWTWSSSYFTHTINPFSTEGYYYLSEDSAPAPAIGRKGTAGVSGTSKVSATFVDYTFHELEAVKLGETGHQLLGEDFKWTPSQTFTFTLPDLVEGEQASMACQFVARTVKSTSTLHFTVNGTELPQTSTDVIRATTNSSHSHGEAVNTRKNFTLNTPTLNLGIRYAPTGTVSAAHLDFIEVNYQRYLRLYEGKLRFDLTDTRARLGGATAATRVWDVTDPLNIFALNTEAAAGGGVSWTNDYTGFRSYVAWDESAVLPSPAYVCDVPNQDLHNADLGVPDMVIFALPAWTSEAERVAQLHRDPNGDNLDVRVVNPENIYHEFGSGVADVNAIRRYLKMLYDRGNSADSPRTLKYALIMGQPTFDNRRISDKGQTISYPTLPTWQSDYSLDDNVSYTTDDIFSFLDDDSGRSLGSDRLCIAVGRMPVRTAAEAKIAVDKLYEYTNSMTQGAWRNQVMLVADDENTGIHMEQSDSFHSGVLATEYGDQYNFTKVYIDAFEKRNSTYPEARDRMFRTLDEGTLWWNYIGHANPTSWTSEKILTYNDINNLYLRRFPVLYAATCEFLNWDSGSMPGAEILYFNRYGGIIAAITAVRPVYISDNGLLTKALANKLFQRGDDGRYLPLGEMYRQGKNNITDRNGRPQNNTNKLRFVLMGDPAMRLAVPANRVVVEKINGEAVDPDAQITVMARQRFTVEGYVADWRGELLPDFNGDVSIDIYDAEHSTTSRGYGKGKKYTFEEQGDKLYSGREAVTAGRFSINVAMPETVENNFRPAAMNLYARSDAGSVHDASGMCRDFYVYGFDTEAEEDLIPPVVEMAYLNHPSFVQGGTVNPTPLLVARVSDNVGLNLATLGVGHTMTLQIDGGDRTFNNVSTYFTPDIGSRSGVIQYPLEELSEGAHSLRLRVWDTSGNVGEYTLECFVQQGAAPTIYDIYTDANPASVEANFYLVHDRPDMIMTVKVEIFNLMGQPVWSSESTGRSDMYTSTPVTWNLSDNAGRRVNRGIYLYRATITEIDGEQHVTKTSRIAVTGN